MNKNIWIGIVVIVLLLVGGWWYLNQSIAPSTFETSQLPTVQGDIQKQGTSNPAPQTSPSNAQPSVSIDASSLTTTSVNPTISGSANGVTNLKGLSLYSGSAMPSEQTELCAAANIHVTNGRWSVTLKCQMSTRDGFTNGLVAGTYKVTAYIDANNYKDTTLTIKPSNLGSYQYMCEGGATFAMTPVSDMSSIYVVPLGNSLYPATSTLLLGSAVSGPEYNGNDMVLFGRGENIILSIKSSSISCSPIFDQNRAPFNFGN